MKTTQFALAGLLAFSWLPLALANHNVRTNAVHMVDAPDWVSANRINNIIEPIEQNLEWDVRRTEVHWYYNESDFENVHHLGAGAVAVTMKNPDSAKYEVYLGPKVTDENFDGVLGHELIHVIIHQKYKDAIPLWLDEGLANYYSKRGKVDYAWLAKHEMPSDVRELTHPFNGSEDHVRYHYMASQALAEMLASSCDLAELLRLSVGRHLEDYLGKHCGIKDLTSSFKAWIHRQAPGS